VYLFTVNLFSGGTQKEIMLPANINCYDINDTIIAVSSGTTSSAKKIIRISGDKTFDILRTLTEDKHLPKQRKIVPALLKIAEDFASEAKLYLFPCPHSYTGENLAEIHLFGCDEIVELLFSKLLALGCRIAQAGEFTYRAYLNAKMDLSQSEAVAQIISSSNQYQLCAAQRLFGGSLEQKVCQIRQEILELLSLIEASLDFSTEDIELITTKKAVETTKKIHSELDGLLAGSITFEQIAGAPSVIIAGSANAGKSSLVNALIGTKRSIVSSQSGTTRDCLEHWLKLDKCDCVLFDCAGLVAEPTDIIQSLANTAVLKAINDSTVVIFCADITKEDYSTDLEILGRLSKKPVIYAATKCDLLTAGETEEKIALSKQLFGCDFVATSAKELLGLEKLRKLIQQNIITQTSDTAEAAEKTALTARHKQAVAEAIKNIENASVQLSQNNEEVAAFVLRSALQNLASFEAEHIDEAILETIFSQFCIGK
jgi:tRNA modification GTPase